MGGQQFVRSVFGREESPTSCGYVVMVTTSSTSMIPLERFMDMDTAHPRLCVRQIHIQARMQNTEQMHQNGQIKQSRSSSFKHHPMYGIHVKLGYEQHDTLRSLIQDICYAISGRGVT